MRPIVRLLVTTLGVVALLVSGITVASAHERGDLLSFESMTPVTGAAVGTVNSRGIKGGGLPWVITSGRGEVDRNGTVDVTVKGLVIPVAPFSGTNPVNMFKATLSCIVHGVVVNSSTGNFPANTAGDSHIQGTLSVPRHCRQPILFVAAPSGQWFAMSNLDEESDD